MQGLDDTSWDIMSGTAVECVKTKEVIISAKGMIKIEFDEFIYLFSAGLELQGWKKTFSGVNIKGDLEVRFKSIKE
jgi:hypothetical protein